MTVHRFVGLGLLIDSLEELAVNDVLASVDGYALMTPMFGIDIIVIVAPSQIREGQYCQLHHCCPGSEHHQRRHQGGFYRFKYSLYVRRN